MQDLEQEISAKEATVQDVVQEGRGLMEQLERGLKKELRQNGSFGSILLSFILTEAENVESVRTNVDLILTEWDFCKREVRAACERVLTQSRVRAAAEELAEVDRLVEEHDRWLERSAAVEKCSEVELANLSGECRVRFAVSVSHALI